MLIDNTLFLKQIRRLYCRCNLGLFKILLEMFFPELSEFTRQSLPSAEDPSKLFPTFNNKLNKLINTCTISKLMSKHESKQLEKPWITKGIKKQLKQNMSFFSSTDWERYKLYKNKVHVLSLIRKNNYYHKSF